MSIKDIIYEIFESKEMAEYLVENVSKLSEQDILNMICSAPVDIRRKAKILKELAETENVDSIISELLESETFTSETEKKKTIKMVKENSFRFNYKICAKAVKELENSRNAIFTLQNVWVDEDMIIGFHYSEVDVCSSFEGAMEIIKEQMEFEEWTWNNKNQLFWYVLTKWIPDKNGRYKQVADYYIINNKVAFFLLDNNRTNKFAPNCHLNLITPFKTGDMLCVDCTPFAEEQNVLVLENENNYDCCSLQAICVCEDERLKVGAIKHATILPKWLYPEISPLYKIRRADNLKTEEKILFEIQTYIKSDAQKGRQIWELAHKGITIEEMKKYLEESYNE